MSSNREVDASSSSDSDHPPNGHHNEIDATRIKHTTATLIERIPVLFA